MDQQTSQDRERKKAAAEMPVPALLERRDRRGYEVAKLIEQRSGGTLVCTVAAARRRSPQPRAREVPRRDGDRGWDRHLSAAS